MFQFLEGTVIKEGIEEVWERFRKAVPASQRARLAAGMGSVEALFLDAP